MERTHPLFGFAASVGKVIISVVGTIVLILNVISGITGGIWLAILGHWWSIGIGIGFAVVMPWIYSLLSLPSTGLAFIVGFFAERGSKTFTGLLGLLASLYQYALIAAWNISVFLFFMDRADEKSVIPYLFWCFSTVMAPLSYMAKNEPPESFGTWLGLFFTEVSYFIWVMFYFFGTNFLTWIYWNIGVGVLFSLLAMSLTIVQMVETERNQQSNKFVEPTEDS